MNDETYYGDLTVRVVYEARTTEDEHGRYGETIGYYDSETEANETVKFRGWYGGPGRVLKANILIVGNGEGETLRFVLAKPEPIRTNVDLIRSAEMVREAALTKLKTTMTGVELKALGIDLERL